MQNYVSETLKILDASVISRNTVSQSLIILDQHQTMNTDNGKPELDNRKLTLDNGRK